jgi:hypothetical protein
VSSSATPPPQMTIKLSRAASRGLTRTPENLDDSALKTKRSAKACPKGWVA